MLSNKEEKIKILEERIVCLKEECQIIEKQDSQDMPIEERVQKLEELMTLMQGTPEPRL